MEGIQSTRFADAARMETTALPKHNHRRARTLSTFSLASNQSLRLKLDIPKAAPANSIALSSPSGSFSPTTSACLALRSFAQCSTARERTVSLHSRPKPKLRPAQRPMWIGDASAASPSRTDSSASISSSPRSIESATLSIPSISRTASSFSGSDDVSTAPTSVHSSRDASPRRATHPEKNVGTKLHPILAACEKGSKFTTRTICATCSKPGRDYPKCAKCGEMWCSRTCRLKDGAKRHVCASS